tara:strand:+ start:15 stop:239 length:225 start_codon:yes stop_codon:yes gene_type:complete
MPKLTLDGKEYDTENLSDNAKAQLASLQFNEVHMNRLRNELAIADTAKIAYTRALKLELEGETKVSDKETKDNK